MNLVFDFDGTICDGTETAIEILNLKFNKLDKPSTSLKELRNKGLKHILVSRSITSDQLHKANVSGRKIFGERIPYLKTFYGLTGVIKKIAKEHTLGILTSNASENVHLFLVNHYMDSHFSFVENELDIFGKEKMLRKLKADFYIGDETRDIEAAKKAGAKSVAVTWGFESEKLLRKSNPDYLINDPQDLLILI